MANVQYVDIVFHSVRKYEEQENNSCPWGDGHVNRHLNQATNIAKENKGYFFNDLGVIRLSSHDSKFRSHEIIDTLHRNINILHGKNKS